MYKRTTLGLEEANKATQAIIDYTNRNKEKPISVAVVDDRGELVMFTRMDGAAPNTVNMAINKAYTSARRRRDTSTIKKVHQEKGFENTDWGDIRFTTVGGGVCVKETAPVKEGSGTPAVVGAIGVSGQPSAEVDDQLARMGLDAING